MDKNMETTINAGGQLLPRVQGFGVAEHQVATTWENETVTMFLGVEGFRL